MSKIDFNFVSRYTKQSYNGFTAATKVRANNRKLIYSKYRPFNVFQPVNNELVSSCSFTPDDQCLLVGTCHGLVLMFNKYNDNLIAQNKVHRCWVSSLVPHKSGELLLTSGYSSFSSRESALWYTKNTFENQFMLNNCMYAAFTHAQDKVLGTSLTSANLYDLNTGQVIHDFKQRTVRLYQENKAALDPTDVLILTDGVMFDIRSGKEVHTFDILYTSVNGTFHTNRLEIASSSQIWDLRTFHLLQTVEKLKCCDVQFNNCGDVIFGFDQYEYYGSDLKVFDSSDYSSIATVDGVHNVVALAVSPMDTQIAVAKESRSLVHLYDIGTIRHEEELDDEDDDYDLATSHSGSDDNVDYEESDSN